MSRPYFALHEHWGLTRLMEGQPFFVDRRCRDITPWLLLGGFWETFVDEVLCALVRPGDTFVDVGANVGYYTVKIGGRTGPDGRVFALEANPEIFAILRENVNINELAPRAQLFNMAAGDGPGTLRFHHDPNHPGGGCLLLDHEAADGRLEVRTIPVSRVEDLLPPDAIADLIKIDVEGHEPAALAGMEALLRRSPGAAIVCEVATSRWRRFGDPSELLRRFAGDRALYRIHTDGQVRRMESGDLSEHLSADFVSYVLMLPQTPEHLARIERFLPGWVDPASIPPPPPPPPTLGERLRARLRRLTGGG